MKVANYLGFRFYLPGVDGLRERLKLPTSLDLESARLKAADTPALPGGANKPAVGTRAGACGCAGERGRDGAVGWWGGAVAGWRGGGARVGVRGSGVLWGRAAC